MDSELVGSRHGGTVRDIVTVYTNIGPEKPVLAQPTVRGCQCRRGREPTSGLGASGHPIPGR